MKNNNSKNDYLAKKLKKRFGKKYQHIADERELNVLPECKDYLMESTNSMSVAKNIYDWSMGGNEILAQSTDDLPLEIKKRSISSCINIISEEILQDLNFKIVEGTCYYYQYPTWHIVVDSMQFAVILRQKWSRGSSTLNLLGDNEYKKLFNSIKVNPRIQISGTEFDSDTNLICLKDSIYDIENDSFRDATPDDYCISKIDISESEILHCQSLGYFDNYLSTLSGGDPEIEQLLLEVIGVLLSRHMPKNFFLLYGSSNSGKSTLAKFIAHLIGISNTYSVSDMNKLSQDKWLMGSLAGKKLLVSMDLPSSIIYPSSVSVLKQLTGDCLFLVSEIKNRQPFMTKNTAKILMATNHPLRTKDHDMGLLNRAVVIPLLNEIPYKDQNYNLVENLMQERGYIFSLCMVALRTWGYNNYIFTAREKFLHYAMPTPATHKYSTKVVQEELIERFICSKCILKEDHWISTANLYVAFQDYCLGVHCEPCDRASFGRYLAQIQGVSSKKQSDIRGFVGIDIQGDDTNE